MKRITGHLAEKNNKWYAVINLYDTDGNRKEKWKSLDLPVKKGNKTEANHRMNEIIAQYNTGELYLMESLSHADQERRRIADMCVEDYLLNWVEQHKGNVSESTYHNYKQMIRNTNDPVLQTA